MIKQIGIPGWMLGENSFGVGVSYIEFIYNFGRPIVITPMDSADPPEVDLVIAPGGADILPTSYGSVPGFRTQRSNPFLEHFDHSILPEYIRRGTPVFGICRGMQRLWTMYGGFLNQNNNWHKQSEDNNDQCHELEFTENFKYLSSSIKKVTSRHHQCADASLHVPDELEVIAYAKESKRVDHEVVEIFRHKKLPIYGVQFHPEDHDWTDRLSPKLVRDLLK